MPEAVVHLSSLVGSPLLDSSGERLGRVEDLIVRLDADDELPPVTGLKARIGGRELFVPAERIERLEPEAARTSTTKLNLAQFERRPGEVLLRSDVLGRSMIHVAKTTAARLSHWDGTPSGSAALDPSVTARIDWSATIAARQIV